MLTRTKVRYITNSGRHCQLNSWSRMFLENFLGLVICFYGSRGFITIFTSTQYWSLSSAKWIHSTPSHPIYPRSSPILSSHLHLPPLSGLFPWSFPIQNFTHFSPLTWMLHAPSISSSLICSPWQYLVKSTDYTVPLCADSSSLLLLPPSEVLPQSMFFLCCTSQSLTQNRAK